VAKVDGSAILAAIGKTPAAAKSPAYDEGSETADADRAAKEFAANPSCESFLACLTLCQATQDNEPAEGE
jgi:hypothetical protein